MAAERTPQHLSTNDKATNYLAGAELLSVTVPQHDHTVAVAHVAGEVDMLTGPSPQRHLDKTLSALPERLIVDLSQVPFLGATGLAHQCPASRQPTGRHAATPRRSSATALPLQATELAYLFEILPRVDEHSGTSASALNQVRRLRRG